MARKCWRWSRSTGGVLGAGVKLTESAMVAATGEDEESRSITEEDVAEEEDMRPVGSDVAVEGR